MRSRRLWAAFAVAALAGGAAAAVVAQGRFDKIEVKTEKLADGLWVLYGAGGNIAVDAGPDGMLLVDAQYAEMAPKVLAAARQLSDRPLRWLVNTHWHGDHTGADSIMAESGALIFAQDRVRERLIEGQDNKFFGRKVAPVSGKALPVVTFAASTTLHVNGDDAFAFHVPPAHTDGDVMVWFPKANVLHMGDTFFNGLYPIIDLESGGSVDGMIAAAETGLARVGNDTKIIPGHGNVTDKATLQAYRDMLVGVRAAVAALVKQGKSLDETVAAKPTAPWDDKWGKGFVKPDVFTKVVYTDLSAKK